MGNCCSGDDPKAEYETEPPLEERDYHPNDNPNTPFLGTPDVRMATDSDLRKSFLLQKSLSKDHKSTSSSSSNSPSNEEERMQLLFNPKLVPLLEFFRHLYVRKRDLFRRIISVHGDDLVEVLKKVGQVEARIGRPRIEMMQRSRSLGPSQDPKNERFKMATFKPDEGQPPSSQGGKGNGDAKASAGSK